MGMDCKFPIKSSWRILNLIVICPVRANGSRIFSKRRQYLSTYQGDYLDREGCDILSLFSYQAISQKIAMKWHVIPRNTLKNCQKRFRTLTHSQHDTTSRQFWLLQSSPDYNNFCDKQIYSSDAHAKRPSVEWLSVWWTPWHLSVRDCRKLCGISTPNVRRQAGEDWRNFCLIFR
jgi:hypothetical protein